MRTRTREAPMTICRAHFRAGDTCVSCLATTTTFSQAMGFPNSAIPSIFLIEPPLQMTAKSCAGFHSTTTPHDHTAQVTLLIHFSHYHTHCTVAICTVRDGCIDVR